MYALVEILGKQYKAEAGKEIRVDLVDAELGSQVTYESVLAVVDGDKAKFGAPYVKGASVVATLQSNFKDAKVRVYKFHRRKGYRRTQGHRQQYSILKIDSVNA
jgi:large subunit ribosomal protein L21